MESSINRFTTQFGNGLYLIDMPTGVGKTYQAIKYIYDHINEDRKFFYITSLNKNVDSAYEDLKAMFHRDGKDAEFLDKCLRIYSNAEKVIEELINVETDYNDALMKLDSFKRLKSEVEIYHSIKKESFEQSVEILERILKDIKEKYEPEFRREVESYLKKSGSNKKERFQFVKDNHKWLINIYPSIMTSYRKVYFLSLDKFYLGNSTLIESAYKFINKNDIYKNAVIFIDEIDAAKDTILNRQIEESLKNNINIFKLFIDIRNTLESKKFPKEMLRPSKHNLEDKNRQQKILIEMKRIFSVDFNENNLQYAFKTLEKDLYRKYIFDDGSYSTITQDNDKKEIYVITSTTENYNYLSYEEKEGSIKLSKVLGTINGAIKFFLKGVYLLAINYREYYNEHKGEKDDMMQHDDAVQSIVKAFNIENNMIPYVCNLVTGNVSTKHRYNTTFSTSVYDSGFRYYYFEDNINNNLNTDIKMYNLWDTPESFLLQLSQKSFVIGLSATSTLDTVTGNFDVEYLKQHLDECYFVPTQKEKESIDGYVDSVISTNKSKIDVHIVDSVDLEDSIKELFVEEDYCEWLDNLVKMASNDDNDYNKHRLLKVFKVIKNFISNEKGKSLLILTNRNLSERSNDLYSLKNVEEFINKYVKENNLNNCFKVINLVTKSFEEKKDEYQRLINKNKRVIIFSSYPTTGAGQNLQYEFTDNNRKEDIDSIYIENPTNLLVLTSNFNQEKDRDLIKYIFQIESLNTSGEVSLVDKYMLIKEAFRRMSDPRYIVKHKNPYDTNSVRNHGLRVLIQAIGRICRTRHKNKDVNIYLDNYILSGIDLKVAHGRRLNKEFECIVEATKTINSKTNDLQFYVSLKKAQVDSKKMSEIIHNFISRNEWADNIIKDWKALREHVLKYPTACDENLGVYGQYANCYLKSDDLDINYYYYQHEDDYGSVSISIKRMDGYLMVSESDSLSRLMNCSMIKKYFVDKGYSTTFEKKKYIMLPIIYNNIYKGALGEEAGWVIFKNVIGIELNDITDGKKFEKFDFEYNGYYIDFKHWKNTPYSKVELDKFIEKANLVGAKKAFVINVLGDNSYPVKEINNLVIVPSLIDFNSGDINVQALRKIASIIRR